MCVKRGNMNYIIWEKTTHWRHFQFALNIVWFNYAFLLFFNVINLYTIYVSVALGATWNCEG